MCCSSHGASSTLALQLQAAALAPVSEPARASARVRYRGVASLSLRGPFSGRVYELTAVQNELAIDPRDLHALLRTGLFETMEP